MGRVPPVTALLPHAPPMVLLDEVLEHEGDCMACSVTVREGAPFVRDGRVATVVALEYMAQCIAAFAGLDALASGDGPRIGFLIGCRELQLLRDAIPVGTTLAIEVKRVWGDALL